MKLADAIALAGGVHRGRGFGSSINITRIPLGKHFYQNNCWVAGGKCLRCKVSAYADRNWRELGREVP